MSVNRGLVGAVAIAVLVWGVAFGGGLTLAVLTSSTDVTTTFETADELTPIDESAGDGPAAATVPVGNEPNETRPSGNETPPPENASLPPENASSPPGNASVPPGDPVANGSESTGDGTAPPENGSESTGNTPASPADEGDPATNESASTGDATAESTPALRAADFEA